MLKYGTRDQWEIDDFDALDYVEVNGDITVFNNQMQLSIKRARKVDSDTVDASNYLPCTDKTLMKC